MEQVILISFIRAFIAFVMLLIVLRIIGRKAVSHLTLADLGVGVTLGSVTANLAVGDNHKPLAVATILVSIGILAALAGYLSLKSKGLRKLMETEPVTVIENGRLNERNMARTRLNLDSLMSLLREKSMFNIADVEFAVFETDGKLSVLPKSQKRPLTPSDMNLSTRYTGLTTDLITDGTVLKDNLAAVNLDEKWLSEQLHSQGIVSPSGVFYAGLDSHGGLYISRKTGVRPPSTL